MIYIDAIYLHADRWRIFDNGRASNHSRFERIESIDGSAHARMCLG